MLKAFFDESGTNPQRDKALVMGGFLARADEWEFASDEWKIVREQHPPINHYSHHAARILQGPFLGFSRSAADEKERNLARVVAQFDLQGFMADTSYTWFSGRDRRASRKMVGTKAYEWGFLTAIYAVLDYVKAVHPEEEVDFIFDRNTSLPRCLLLLSELRSLYPERFKQLGECIPGDDQKLAPLQMGDMLAGELSEQIRSGHKNDPFVIIASRNPIARMPALLPADVPKLLATQKLAREVQDQAHDILRRIYKDKERSVELLADIAELAERKAIFDQEFGQLKESYERDVNFQEFIKKQGKNTQ